MRSTLSSPISGRASWPRPSAIATPITAAKYGIGSGAAGGDATATGARDVASVPGSSPAMTWTLIFPARRTRSCTTEPFRISNQRDLKDLPITICVALFSRA